MQKAILVFALSLNTLNNVICAVSLGRGFCRKKTLSQLNNTKNGCHGNQSVSCDQALDKLSEKLNGRPFVQEEHGFKRGHNVPPWPQEQKKKPGLDRVKAMSQRRLTVFC